MGNVTAKTSGDIASFMTPAETNIKSLKVYFSPKQLGEGDPSPDNVREIQGWDGVETHIYNSDFQITPINGVTTSFGVTWTVDNNGLIKAEGTPTSWSSCSMGYIDVKGNEIIKGFVYGSLNNVTLNKPVLYNSKNEIIPLNTSDNYDSILLKFLDLSQYEDVKRVRITLKRNTNDIYMSGSCYVVIKKQENINKPFKTDFSFDWSSDVGTVYGGYVDLISGELVEEYTNIRLNADTSCGEFRVQSNGKFTVWTDVTGMKPSFLASDEKALCDKAIKTESYKNNTALEILLGNNNSSIYLYNMNAIYNLTTIEQISAWLEENPIHVTVPLATPITHQLTPTQLSSFIGQNNFWSNADYVEIEYELKETEDIQKARKKIILNQPHIENVKDDLVNFNTDMKAPLKECKVYFEPVQEGSGDPSPENVKEIKGWDETNIYLSNEITLFNSFGATSGRASGINNNKRVTTNSYGTTINRTDTDGIKTELVVTQSIADSTKERYQNGYVSLFPNTDKLTVGNTYYFDADIEIISNPLDKLPEIMLTDDANNRWTITINDGKLHESFIWKERPTVYQYPFIEFYCNGCSFKLKNMVITPAREIKTVGWSDEAETVYGGYIDLVKGELVANMTMIEFDGSSDENWQVETLSSGLTNYYMYASSLVLKARGNQRTDGYICSNMCIPRGENETYTSGMFYFSASGALNVYLGGKSNTSTVAEFKSWLTEHKLQIAYWLETPIHYSLTPQQLLTFKGTNNIWSDTNGQTEVKFWTH